MVGRSRVLGLECAGALACLVLGLTGCIAASDEPAGLIDSGHGAGGSAGSSSPGTPPFAGPTGGASGVTVAAPCGSEAVGSSAVFAKQALDAAHLARRELFSWTTNEQAAALRRDQVLFTRSERSSSGPGYAFAVLAQIAQDETDPEGAELAALLGGEPFAEGRYAWGEPWAMRLGWPGEAYGGNLLRIVLKPEAWVVVVRGGVLSVIDLENHAVTLTQALATPSRLGAIFYQKDGFAGGPTCDGISAFDSNGYREFIVGNLAMVEEWSLGTRPIRERLSANIQQLSSFFERVRACPVVSNEQSWNEAVVCSWDEPINEYSTELFAYQLALAIPSANYLAVPERIVELIETLQGDLFEIDPLVVTPGSP